MHPHPNPNPYPNPNPASAPADRHPSRRQLILIRILILFTLALQIVIPADGSSLAGAVLLNSHSLNLARAEDHPAFKKDIDRKTGYKTESVLVMPIRRLVLVVVVEVVVVVAVNDRRTMSQGHKPRGKAWLKPRRAHRSKAGAESAERTPPGLKSSSPPAGSPSRALGTEATSSGLRRAPVQSATRGRWWACCSASTSYPGPMPRAIATAHRSSTELTSGRCRPRAYYYLPYDYTTILPSYYTTILLYYHTTILPYSCGRGRSSSRSSRAIGWVSMGWLGYGRVTLEPVGGFGVLPPSA